MNEDFGKSLKIRILEETLNELKRKNVTDERLKDQYSEIKRRLLILKDH